MKIFSATQIKKWDDFTIQNEPISSIDLMERAAIACYRWVFENNFAKKQFQVFCGKGNNGGDGLAIARLLIQNNYSVTVYILEFGNIGTADFQTNLAIANPSPPLFPLPQKTWNCFFAKLFSNIQR